MSLKYPRLFEPLAIGSAVFRNRIFASPQGFYNVGKDNLPGRDEAAYFERKALGGFASVCVGDCIVDSATGTHYPFLIRMDDPSTLPALSCVADAISRHGAVAAAELSHAGMYAQFVKAPDSEKFGPDNTGAGAAEAKASRGGILYGPVAMADGKYGEVEEMPEALILHITEKYGKAAAWAKRCGFGMVTVHGGHGWLLAQFMSPMINTRKDRWGGSLENRMRFPLAVIESIRKAVGPKFPVEIRISGSECDEEGYDISEGIKFAKALDQKVDILHVSAGNHEFNKTFVITHPSVFLPDGVNVRFAEEIKKHVKTPVATVGALTDPAMMEEIIASGKADIVALGRQSLADPDLPRKAREGRDDDIDRCLRCTVCFGGAGERRRLRCSINPEIGREEDEKMTRLPAVSKRVLVAGGGVGGMQAALTSARRGHEVILCEKSGKLGGVLLCESEVPFKKRVDEYLARQARRAAAAGVEIRLNTPLTPELARKIKPDVIIAALGARPFVPPIPGINGKNVFGAEELYKEPGRAGKRLVIIGGGLVGLELGVFLAGRGCSDITVVEVAPELTLDPFGMHTMALTMKIEELGIKIHTETRVSEIKEDAVFCENKDGAFSLPADTVVCAAGQTPNREEAFALHDCAPEFYQLGDCVTPANIYAATHTAHAIAKDIGCISL
ncbi:MAG: NAD(P)/FAD-dependent oxidoreductase [Oscillospiraceae bacterium]|nr:NAD(P)/FAD-dependent oxidoreductase [Oscillospiraceae bacterium]